MIEQVVTKYPVGNDNGLHLKLLDWCLNKKK